MKLQMRLSGTAEDLVLGMTERLEMPVREIVMDALALYHFAIEEISNGRRVGGYDPVNREFTGIATTALQSYANKVESEKEIVA